LHNKIGDAGKTVMRKAVERREGFTLKL